MINTYRDRPRTIRKPEWIRVLKEPTQIRFRGRGGVANCFQERVASTTTFLVKLKARTAHRKATISMTTTRLRILLIDDDEDALVIIRQALRSITNWQIQLDWAQTYEQGLQQIDQQVHDLYLVDYRLKEGTGLELIREATVSGCRAPIIMLTGFKDREVDVQAMEAGAADYLVKNRIDESQLERSIRYSLERHRLHKELDQKVKSLRALAEQLNHAEQAERSRIARLLHDHLQQVVVSAKMHVEHMDECNVAEQRCRVLKLLDEVMQTSRTLSIELSPPVLLDAGLAAALSWLANWMERTHNLRIVARIDPEAEPEIEAVRLMLFHAVRELLFNIVKHTNVDEAQVTMDRVANQVRIIIMDDGPGFDTKTLDESSSHGSRFGLVHLRDRMMLSGGRMEITTEPGRGCRITLLAPRTTLDVAHSAEVSAN